MRAACKGAARLRGVGELVVLPALCWRAGSGSVTGVR